MAVCTRGVPLLEDGIQGIVIEFDLLGKHTLCPALGTMHGLRSTVVRCDAGADGMLESRTICDGGSTAGAWRAPSSSSLPHCVQRGKKASRPAQSRIAT